MFVEAVNITEGWYKASGSPSSLFEAAERRTVQITTALEDFRRTGREEIDALRAQLEASQASAADYARQ